MPRAKRERQQARREAAERGPIAISREFHDAARAAVQRIAAAQVELDAANDKLEHVRLRTLMAAGITDPAGWLVDVGSGPVPVLVFRSRPMQPAAAVPVDPPAEPLPVDPPANDSAEPETATQPRLPGALPGVDPKVGEQIRGGLAAAAEGGG